MCPYIIDILLSNHIENEVMKGRPIIVNKEESIYNYEPETQPKTHQLFITYSNKNIAKHI